MEQRIGGRLLIQIDPIARAIYIYLREIGPGEAKKTERVAPGLHVDLDESGAPLGIEVLAPEAIDKIFQIVVPQYHVDELLPLREKLKALRVLLAA